MQIIAFSAGSPGSNYDGGIIDLTSLKTAIEGKHLGLSESEMLDGDDVPIPYHLIGGDAFAMKTWLRKPFSQRNLKEKNANF